MSEIIEDILVEEVPQEDANEHQEAKNRLYTERMNLQSQLADGDYKVIKCAESLALSLPMPYDIATLHGQRAAMRARIDAIDEELKELDGDNPEV